MGIPGIRWDLGRAEAKGISLDAAFKAWGSNIAQDTFDLKKEAARRQRRREIAAAKKMQ